MIPGKLNRHSALLAGLYTFALIGVVLNVAGETHLPPSILTPLAMALLGIVAFGLTYELHLKTIGAVAGTLLLVFLALALGVNSGFPFGDFAYTSQLGPKILDVPVLVPFACLGILIPAWVAADKVLRYRNLVVASIIVTAFDMVLEFGADSLDLWHWKGGLPTELNYISWFGISCLAFTILEKYAKEKEPSIIVPHLLFAQLLYFALTDAGLRFFIRH